MGCYLFAFCLFEIKGDYLTPDRQFLEFGIPFPTMKHITLKIVFLGAFLCLFGCAQTSAQTRSQSAKPVWVDKPSAIYPDALFVSATGGGKSREAAENSAKAALVAYFKQSVSSQITIVDTEQQAGGKTVQSTSSASMSIEATAALDALIGVEIKDVWNDTKGKSGWWALVVMEKAQGRERYTAELNKVIGEINLLSDVSGGITFDTIAKCRSARKLLPKAEVYALILSMVNGPDRHKELIQLASKVDNSLTQARAIPIDVRVTGDRNGQVRAAFAKAFTDQGFRTGNSNSRYALEVKLTLEAAPKNQYYNTRYTVDAILRDTQTEAELLTYNAWDRESHTASQADADNRAIIGALKAIQSEFPGVLEEFLSE